MAVVIPQVVTEERASGAPIIEGATRFLGQEPQTGEGAYLTRAQTGNHQDFTISLWFKKDEALRNEFLFYSHDTLPAFGTGVGFLSSTGQLRFYLSSDTYSEQKFRDNEWYHLVVNSVGGVWTAYVNGKNIRLSSTTAARLGGNFRIGCIADTTGSFYKGLMTQFYCIQGQNYPPEFFGFRDGLTGTWRPKTYTQYSQKYNGSGIRWAGSSRITSNTTILQGSGSSIDDADMFSDNTNATYISGSGGDYILWTPDNPIVFKDKIEVQGFASNQTAYLNSTGTGVLTENSETLWCTIASGGGTINNIKFVGNNGIASIKSIRVDGETLLNDYNGFGTNGFYLPMDGKSLLTKDMSPNGNDFTQYGMDMTVSSIEEATGAFPILKTSVSGDAGGAVRTVNKTIEVTVQNDGGNKYFFNGVRYSPGTFPLYRGGSYTFDQSDASNGGGGTHPLRFATAEDAAGSTEYTDGVTQNGTPGQAGAYTRITVPHNAPDTLYYYCTNHGGMGGPTANTTDEVVCDPYGWKNILALPGIVNGPIGGGTAVPIDYSDQLNYGSTATSITKGGGGPSAGPADNTLNRRGLSQQGTIYYGSALHWQGGSTDFLNIGGNGDFDMGTEDFTIECWARLNGMGASNASAFFTTAPTTLGSNPYLNWGFQSGTGLCVNAGSFTPLASFDATPYFNKWTHYAICRNGSTIRMFANGQLMSSGSNSTDLTYTNQAKIGQRYNNQSAYSLQGQMSDYRIYRGVGKYTENFKVWNPNGSNFTNAPSGVVGEALDTSDYGSWETGEFTSTATYGAVIWPPSSDYEFDGDFTIEMFIRNKNNFNSTDNSYILTASDFYRLFLGCTGEGDFDNNYFYPTGTGSRIGWSNLLRRRIRYNCWHHIAVTRESGSIRAFVDGEQIGDAYSESGTLGVGAGKLMTSAYGNNGSIAQGAMGFRGNICDLHIVKGTALYTRDFDPPTGRIQSHANTKLLALNSSKSLLNCIQGTIHPDFGTGTAYAMWPLDSDINDDSGNTRNLSENGGTTSFITAPANNFGITNCATFTNNGKYLSYAVTPPTDGWTIDAYVYPVSFTSAAYILGWNGTSGNNCSLGLDYNPWNGGGGNGNSPSNVATWAIFGAPNINTYEPVVFNQWTHVRIASSDSAHLTLYINGKLVGGHHTDCTPASPITFGDVQSSRFNGHFAGVRYVDADLGAPDINNLEVTTNGVTTNSPVIRPQVSCGTLYSPPSQSTNNPFLEMNQVRGRSSGHSQLQALYKSGSNGVQRFLDGNLSCDLVSDSTSGYARAFIGDTQIPKTGKWYWEFYRNGTDLTVDPNYGQPYVGICDSYAVLAIRESASPFQNHVSLIGGSGFGYHYGYNGTWRVGRGFNTAGGNLPIGTTMGFAYDADTGEFRVYANGENYTQGVYDTLPIDKDWYPYAQHIYDSDDGGFRSPNNFNFGQKPFKFPPPYGYKSLCEANMQRPSAAAFNPEEHHRVLLSPGTGITESSSTEHAGVFSRYLFGSDSTNYRPGGVPDQDFINSSYLAHQAFNGNTGNGANFGTGGVAQNYGYFIPEPSFSGVTSMRIWTVNVSELRVNGNIITSSITNGSWYTISNPPSTLTEIAVKGASGVTPQINAIEINGRVLRDISMLQLCKNTFPKGMWWMKSRFTESAETLDQNYIMDHVRGNSMWGFPWDGTTGITDGAIRTFTAPVNESVARCWSAPEAWTGATNHVANSGYRNTAAGFSMWQYTGNGTRGNTTSHGLSSAPQFMLIQALGTSSTFAPRSVVYHHLHSANDNLPEVAPIPNYDYYVTLDNGNIYGPDIDNWNSTAPTDSLITLGANTPFNQSAKTYQAYAWHEVEGYSKFGRYAGTESSQTTTADGPYVYLGFKPSFIMIKGIGAAESWVFRDSTRDSYNPVVKHLNQSLAQESTSSFEIDFLHDGFKIRTGDGTMNYTASGPYLYMAFAEAPTHKLYGAQPNAR